MAATLGSGDYHTPLGEHKFPINSTVAGSVQGNHDVFHTSFKYFVAAAVVELVCIAFVLPVSSAELSPPSKVLPIGTS